MEIRELRYFLAVARENSIQLAAESLNITQPGLSKAIMSIEEQLGKKLFIRENRKITITEDGMLLRKRAQEIIALVDKAESEFKEETEHDLTGEIYIGAGETDGMRLVAKTMKKVQNQYPNIHYTLFSGNSDDVKEKLDKGILDFGILIEPVDVSKYDYLRLPIYDTWGLLMRKDNPLSTKKFITANDLYDIPLICSRQSLVKSEFSGWFGRDFEKMNIISTYNLIYNASLLVDEGVGSAITLDKLVHTGNDSNFCFVPLKPSLRANLIIVWKKYQFFSKATQKFFDELQNEINLEK